MNIYESVQHQVITTWVYKIDENYFKNYCKERNITQIDDTIIAEYMEYYAILPSYSENEEIDFGDSKFDDSCILALQKLIEHD